jgi:hypothetical protein
MITLENDGAAKGTGGWFGQKRGNQWTSIFCFRFPFYFLKKLAHLKNTEKLTTNILKISKLKKHSILKIYIIWHKL